MRNSAILAAICALAGVQAQNLLGDLFCTTQGDTGVGKTFCLIGSIDIPMAVYCEGKSGSLVDCNVAANVPDVDEKTWATCSESSPSAGNAVCRYDGKVFPVLPTESAMSKRGISAAISVLPKNFDEQVQVLTETYSIRPTLARMIAHNLRASIPTPPALMSENSQGQANAPSPSVFSESSDEQPQIQTTVKAIVFTTITYTVHTPTPVSYATSSYLSSSQISASYGMTTYTPWNATSYLTSSYETVASSYLTRPFTLASYPVSSYSSPSGSPLTGMSYTESPDYPTSPSSSGIAEYPNKSTTSITASYVSAPSTTITVIDNPHVYQNASTSSDYTSSETTVPPLTSYTSETQTSSPSTSSPVAYASTTTTTVYYQPENSGSTTTAELDIPPTITSTTFVTPAAASESSASTALTTVTTTMTTTTTTAYSTSTSAGRAAANTAAAAAGAVKLALFFLGGLVV